MLKAILFSAEMPKRAFRSVYAQEYDALHEFCAGGEQNVRFEYLTDIESRNAYNSLKRYIKRVRQPLTLRCYKNFVYVFKEAVL